MLSYAVSYKNVVLLFTVRCSSCILSALNANCHLLPRISMINNSVSEFASCILLH